MLKIVSGGQTGVDRGALDAALQVGAPCGGWCPPGRKAEDGRIPERYPVTEIPTGSYRQRTRRNVADSDATLIIYFGEIEGGTQETVQFCTELAKPVLQIDAGCMDVETAAHTVLAFLRAHAVQVLNVAGPRASKQPRAAESSRRIVARCLQLAEA